MSAGHRKGIVDVSVLMGLVSIHGMGQRLTTGATVIRLPAPSVA